MVIQIASLPKAKDRIPFNCRHPHTHQEVSWTAIDISFKEIDNIIHPNLNNSEGGSTVIFPHLSPETVVHPCLMVGILLIGGSQWFMTVLLALQKGLDMRLYLVSDEDL